MSLSTQHPTSTTQDFAGEQSVAGRAEIFSFDDLELKEDLLRGVYALGFGGTLLVSPLVLTPF